MKKNFETAIQIMLGLGIAVLLPFLVNFGLLLFNNVVLGHPIGESFFVISKDLEDSVLFWYEISIITVVFMILGGYLKNGFLGAGFILGALYSSLMWQYQHIVRPRGLVTLVVALLLSIALNYRQTRIIGKKYTASEIMRYIAFSLSIAVLLPTCLVHAIIFTFQLRNPISIYSYIILGIIAIVTGFFTHIGGLILGGTACLWPLFPFPFLFLWASFIEFGILVSVLILLIGFKYLTAQKGRKIN